MVAVDAAFIQYSLRPNLPRLGPRYGKQLASIRSALASADARSIADRVARGQKIELSTNGETFSLDPDDVLVDTRSAEGFTFAESEGMLVALDKIGRAH